MSMDILGGKFLTFDMEGEEYGIPIQKVKEIIGIMDITSIPKTPQFIKGVINLRGKIIPVMDLRLKFGLSGKEYDHRTCIIVVEIELSSEKRLMGIVVDTVAEVINVQSGDIEAPPQYGDDSEISFLVGMAKFKDKVILLINIEKVLGSEDLVILKDMKTGG